MPTLKEEISEVKTDVKWLVKMVDNHMSEHSRVKLLIYGALISSLVAVVISVL